MNKINVDMTYLQAEIDRLRTRGDDDPAHIGINGTKVWKNKEGECHRGNDSPSKIYPDGTRQWYKNGQQHRDNDLPADIRPTGGSTHALYRAWYKHGKFHRTKGPAIIEDGHCEEWFQEGAMHRVDGPAYVSYTGQPHGWYYNGRCVISAKEFQDLTGHSDEDMLALVIKYGEIK